MANLIRVISAIGAPPAVVRQYLALAVDELGRDEAERIARETNLGPLIRECSLQPQP